MDNRQLLDIIVAFMRSLSDFGNAGRNDLVALIYLVFMKDFYETNRNISLEDMENDEVGLTDDMVRVLNRNLECIMCMSCLVDESALDEFPSKNHWMVVSPDDESDDEGGGDEPHDEEYIINRILYILAGVDNHTLHAVKRVINRILYL